MEAASWLRIRLMWIACKRANAFTGIRTYFILRGVHGPLFSSTIPQQRPGVPGSLAWRPAAAWRPYANNFLAARHTLTFSTTQYLQSHNSASSNSLHSTISRSAYVRHQQNGRQRPQLEEIMASPVDDQPAAGLRGRAGSAARAEAHRGQAGGNFPYNDRTSQCGLGADITRHRKFDGSDRSRRLRSNSKHPAVQNGLIE